MTDLVWTFGETRVYAWELLAWGWILGMFTNMAINRVLQRGR